MKAGRPTKHDKAEAALGTGGLNEPPIAHHYVLVLIVQALTLLALWYAARFFR